jgi:methyl coenzyme M reductase beta subunit
MLKDQVEAIQEQLKKPVAITYDDLGNIVGDDNDLNQLSNIIIQLPKQELTVGSKWTSKSTYNGTASIDPQTGFIVKATTKSNVSMTMNEQGLTLPVTITGTTTLNMK